MVLRHPQTRAYQPDRASRTACRTAPHPADHTPRNPTRESEKFMPSPLTNVSPYQLGSGLVPDPGAGTKASRPVPNRETQTQNRPDDVPGHGTDAKDQSLMARPGLEPGHAAADAPSHVPR